MDLLSLYAMVCGKQQGLILATGARCRRKFPLHVAIAHQSNMMSDVQDVREHFV